MEYLQDFFIKNKVAYSNYHVSEIFLTEIKLQILICRTVSLVGCVQKTMNLKKPHLLRINKKMTSGTEIFYISLRLTKAAFVDAFKTFN